VSDNLTKSRTLQLSAWQLWFIGLALAAILLALGSAVEALRTARMSANAGAGTQSAPAREQAARAASGTIAAEPLDALAAKLDELQARLTRLDTFGERLARLAGFKPQELKFDGAAARGGPWLPNANPSVGQLNRMASELSSRIDDHADQLSLIDQAILDERVKKQSVPSALPVTDGIFSSGFGRRVDPFTHASAFHAGVDFIADPGADILAAAGGLVVTAGYQPEYGKSVEIDHGNGLSTRYAHASKLTAKAGQVVAKGEKIGEVGSTGRSTGSHLHFEVRENGTAINPTKFLDLGK
jgi:murein DD-endopeptidase MepM/ murein hydrolase activator NlpD